MISPLHVIKNQCTSFADSIRWACILEATAPKAGNVYPGRSFTDLNYVHFVQAAEIASSSLTRFNQPLGQRIRNCVQNCRTTTGTNVNLGIVLLLAPLAESSHSGRTIGEVLLSLDESDGKNIFEAIRIADAGGMGCVDEMDVHDPCESIDVLAAMRLAADRDRIARQYAEDFSEIYENVVPILSDSIRQSGDILTGIGVAHLMMLAASPDTLIARKFGLPVAKQVQQRAREIDHSDPSSRRQFDDWLRGNAWLRGNDWLRVRDLGGDDSSQNRHLNPGTTADLIAAALFVLLIPNT